MTTVIENIQIKRLQRKVKKLEKELEQYRRRFDKAYEFEREFRIFHHRFTSRKYDSDWPTARFSESIYFLNRKLEGK